LNQIKILLIDDSVDLGFLVKVSLKPYSIHHVLSLNEARALLKNEIFDLILIDVELPDGSGFKLCSEIAESAHLSGIPKILITAKGSTSDKVFGLGCGADDYVTKPFDPPELKARVDARLRNQSRSRSISQFSCFEFDNDFSSCHLVTASGKTNLQLTPIEYRIFLALMRNGDAPITREELIRTVWRLQGTNIEARGIDTHIAHLRKKLGSHEDIIVSVYGTGYAVKLREAA
jgi:DNA-binding response OmpR family regulator